MLKTNSSFLLSTYFAPETDTSAKRAASIPFIYEKTGTTISAARNIKLKYVPRK
jgi:hypothetical protein